MSVFLEMSYTERSDANWVKKRNKIIFDLLNKDKKLLSKDARKMANKIMMDGGGKTYEDRNRSIKLIGFNKYEDYLSSELWKSIRNHVLKECPVCVCCENPSEQIHHKSYMVDVMIGRRVSDLVSICRRCHEEIEFDDDGNKLQLYEANKKLSSIQKVFKKIPDMLLSIKIRVCEICKIAKTRKKRRFCNKCFRKTCRRR